MKLSSLFVIGFATLASANVIRAPGMEGHNHAEMEMEMDMDMENESSVSSESSESSALSLPPSPSLTPVPHVETHHHGMPILKTNLKPEEKLFWESYNTTTFVTEAQNSNHKFSFYYHISTILFTIVFVYPLAMVAKNVGNVSFYIPLFFTHVILVGTSLLSLSIFGVSAPNLYPGNAYCTMSWILLFSTAIQAVSAMLYFATLSAGSASSSVNSSAYQRVDEENNNVNNTHATGNSSASSSNDWEHSDRIELNRLINEKFTTFNNSFYNKISNNVLFEKLKFVANLLGISNTFVFNFLNWAHFIFFLVYIPTGVATVFVLGKGNTVFNLLAHFIKGGVFFALGLLSLARYCGAFKNLGWAWNYKYSNNSNFSSIISMEMIESSLILFYGCTNVFLEHLANPGGAWSAKDLQHVSIAFIYLGAGICGVITELKLKSWKIEKAMSKLKEHGQSEDGIVSGCPGFSPNPFPIFTIYWTGVLMSQHAQASELSTTIHVQWGNLLVGATVFRFITYLLMMLLPTSKDLTKPSKPITEIIASFGLLCGGLVFMESTDPVVLALEYRGYTAMFTLNLSLGFIALVMAWEMTVFAFKDWLVERRDRLTN